MVTLPEHRRRPPSRPDWHGSPWLPIDHPCVQTVWSLLSAPHHNPVHRLGIILGTAPAEGCSPYADLDCLYSQILSSVPDIPQTSRILGAILVMCQKMHPSELDHLVNLSAGDIYTALIDLHSNIYLPQPSDYGKDHIRIFHASFGDFLMDVSRSKHFFMDSSEIHSDIAFCCLNFINDNKTCKQFSSQSIKIIYEARHVHRVDTYIFPVTRVLIPILALSLLSSVWRQSGPPSFQGIWL